MSAHLRGIVAAVVFIGLSSADASAQSTGASSPYKRLELTKPVWPPFYRPDPKDVKYSKMVADGVCRPTGNRAREFYLTKLVDVNKLPEFAFAGKVAGVFDGAMTVVDDATGERMLVVIHAGVSRVNVSGKGTAELLTAGAFVQFVDRVDAQGMGTEVIDRIEIVTPNLATSAPVEPNKLQTLAGKLLRRDDDHLVVLSASAKRQRLEVRFKLDADIFAHLADYRYASQDDAVKFKGRILRSTNSGQTFCFADDLDVTATSTLELRKDALASRRAN